MFFQKNPIHNEPLTTSQYKGFSKEGSNPTVLPARPSSRDLADDSQSHSIVVGSDPRQELLHP
jgi:hypothetical protein